MSRADSSTGGRRAVAKPFDIASKDLVELDPAGWLALLDVTRPADRVGLVDAEASAVTAAADKVIRVADDPPWLAHLEFQANRDGTLPARTLMYNAILHARHGLPVASAVVLLRPEANSPAVSGVLPFAPPLGPGWAFRYAVVKIWEEPAARLLAGPLGTLPLAPAADVPRADLAEVVRRMKDRIDREADRPTAAKLWTATYIFLGLRYEAALAEVRLEGITNMEESTTYQAILRRGREEGRSQEIRAVLLRMGRRKFGEPPARAEAAFAGMSVERLEDLADRLIDAPSWDDLLPPNPAG